MSRPLILVTNDDGIFAPGIKRLVEVASRWGKVIVVAPDSPQSGQGHAITISSPLRLQKVDFLEHIDAYECNGTPADCVKLAKRILVKDHKIDLCLSGINHGSNASINILYSGTMSAAMEAAMEGINSIGFSLDDFSFDADFEGAAHYVDLILKKVIEHGFPGGCNLLNVNVPKLHKDDIKGLRVCRQGIGYWEEDFQIGEDPRKQKYYWLTGKFVTDDTAEDTDLWALRHGYVSVVPSTYDLTSHGSIDKFSFLVG